MKGRRSGFTLLEVAIALTIFALVAVNISMVSKTGTAAARAGVFYTNLQDEHDQTLDRISLAVMSASSENIYPMMTSPAYTPTITYSVSLGVEDGEVVKSDPELIGWEQHPTAGGKVVWKENPGLEEERNVVWSNWVPALYKKEELNGLDDNGNELPDEQGLAFDMDGEKVNIHLTVERISPDGELVPVQKNVFVTPRN